MTPRERTGLEAAATSEILARRALADLCEEAGQADEAIRHRAVAEEMERSDVVMSTSRGDILLSLDAERAPLTVANFLSYVDEGWYDGTLIHRIIFGFVIQGGGFLPGMRPKGGTKPPIKNEAPNGLSNTRGTIAMARSAALDSGTSQFNINVADNSSGLDGVCVFGKVVAGMDVVDKIRSVRVAYRGNTDVPVEDVIVQSVRRIT